METIINYIENMFQNYPDTPQVRRAKEDLLGIMEDKYHALKDDGKSENEAIGIVISEFGSMDEIVFELGLDKDIAAKRQSAEDGIPEKKVTFDQAKHYIKTEKIFGIKIGIGVALCILSPTLAIITGALEDAGFLAENISDMFGATGLFFMVAAAVGIFITSGISHGEYEEYKKAKILLDYKTKTWLAEQSEAYQPLFGAKIAAGVILCIMAVIPAIIMDEMFEHTALEWITELSALTVFGLVAAGVYLFITAGTIKSAYDTLLGKSHQTERRSIQTKKNKLIKIISAIYWPIITSIYLVVSFYMKSWGVSWMIWPVAGIIFGGISTVISLIWSE